MTSTVYIAPGNSQCRVYHMPYPMRPGQHPRDLAQKFQDGWDHIALLNHELKVVYIEPAFAHLRLEIEGQMGGTYFEVEDGELIPREAIA
ncbi:hypothetical protein D9M68_684830 [compost metagenome]